VDASATAEVSSRQGAADPGAWSHAVVRQGGGECRQCVELAVALNIARSDVGHWRALHRDALKREAKLKREVEGLQAKLKLRERQLFGRRSERKHKGQGKAARPDDAKPEGRRKRGQQHGAHGHGRRRQEELPVQPETHDLPDEEKCCPKCGLPLQPLGGTGDSEVIEVEVRAYRRRIHRKRYRRGCECPGPPRIVTARAPGKLIPKGMLGVSVWVLLFLDKFLFQRPTYRLLLDLELHQLHLAQGTVTDGFQRLSPLFEPLYEALIARNVSESRWHADETRWLVFEELEGKHGHKWYLWAFLSSSTVVFKLSPSRSAEVPKAHFGQEAQGILVVDRYAAYKVLLADGRILLAFCWAHVRRDFLAVAKDWGKQHEAWALGWVDRIAQLYRCNDERLTVLKQPEAFAKAQHQLSQAVEQMVKQREGQLADPQLHPVRRKVLKSLKSHWSGLLLFVAHPEVPMDNNRAERAQRNPVVGRKNYYGSGAVWSGKLAAMMFSLFQTLLLNNLNPRLWLFAYLEACAHNAGQAPVDAEQWLPWNLSEEQIQRFRVTPPHSPDTS
jgi:transposase